MYLRTAFQFNSTNTQCKISHSLLTLIPKSFSLLALPPGLLLVAPSVAALVADPPPDPPPDPPLDPPAPLRLSGRS
jgi:hypothetical protein